MSHHFNGSFILQYCRFMVITARSAKEQARIRPCKGQVSSLKNREGKGYTFFSVFESLILTVNRVVTKYNQT